ncbi:MAG: endonuclease domain-containing protein, partial [Rhizobacter sp.]|nr:endonuclease domain-containing protein [Chlorobiales bacterium]
MKKGLIQAGYHLPYNPKLKQRARTMRKEMTAAEKKLWQEYLRYLPVTVLRQKPIDHYIVDFYCASCKLVIEVDGDSHFTDSSIDYDRERTKILEGYGLKVLRFTNRDEIEKFRSVCNL